MEIIARREIDLSNYAPEELVFVCPKGAQVTLETGDGGSIQVQGHNALSDTYYTLPIIEKISYDIITEITNAGIYDIDITSVDGFRLVTTGSGKIFVKVIGG